MIFMHMGHEQMPEPFERHPAPDQQRIDRSARIEQNSALLGVEQRRRVEAFARRIAVARAEGDQISS